MGSLRDHILMVCLHLLKDIPVYIYTYRMSVNTNGCAVYAHRSMSMNKIVAIIQRSEYLISPFNVLSPADIADTELLFGFVRIRQDISKNMREGR